MIKKLKNYAFSNEHSIEERRFVLTGILCCVSLLAVFISTVASLQGIGFAVGLMIALAIILLVMRYTIRSGRLFFGGCVLVSISNIVIIPVGYMLGGGLHSGAPLWLVNGIILVFVLFRGKALLTHLIIAAISYGLTMYFTTIYPELVVPIPAGYSEGIDVYTSLISVSIVCGLLFLFQSTVLEGELEKADDQRNEIEKMGEMQNNFFASMSHEIRTPINTIIGLNEMTLREQNLPEEVQENTLNIQNASKLLLSLINDILDMSKIQSGKMEIVPAEYDTSRMLSDITNLHWNRAIEKGLHFDIQVGENIPPMLFGDETRVKQVLINLLTNAIKYTEEGSVTIRFGGERIGGGQFLLRVEIEDTGIGIRRENIQHLFDTFQRVDEANTKNIEGTGLGLSIAKQLVDLMGGTISVNSIYTKGSTFRVEIPQKIVTGITKTFQKPGVITREKPSYQQAFEAPEAKVLVVDDNDLNRIVCRKLLRATQVQVDLADSGMECLEMIRNKHYDVIFMDHEMPQMDGVETLHRIRQQSDSMCRDTPVIALTANAGTDREAFYLDKGFSAYLAKPIQSSQLESLLLACLPPDLVEKNYVESEEESIQIYDTIQKLPFMITTDSICDLPEEMLRDNEIKIMPYYIVTQQGRFRDIKEIDSNNLLQVVRNDGYYGRTDPATIEEYEEFFGEALTESRLVVHLSACASTTRAYANAKEAARSFDNVHVVDSEQISTGLGIMAMQAVDLFRKGRPLEEVLTELEAYKKKVKLNFLMPFVNRTNDGYDLNVFTRLIMNVFNVEPAFVAKGGRIRVSRLMMGYVRNTPDQFVHTCLTTKKNINTDRLYVTFSGCSPDKRKHILSEIEKYSDFDEIIVNKASGATFCNSGPDAFGLAYELED